MLLLDVGSRLGDILLVVADRAVARQHFVDMAAGVGCGLAGKVGLDFRNSTWQHLSWDLEWPLAPVSAGGFLSSFFPVCDASHRKFVARQGSKLQKSQPTTLTTFLAAF